MDRGVKYFWELNHLSEPEFKPRLCSSEPMCLDMGPEKWAERGRKKEASDESHETGLSADSPCNYKQGIPVPVTQCSMIPIISLSLEKDFFFFYSDR